MKKRLVVSSALLGLLSVFTLPSLAAAEADDGLATHERDPFLLRMKTVLNQRRPTETELGEIAAFIEKHPNDSYGHAILATAYNKIGMDGMYAQELEKAWQLDPNAILYLFGSLKARFITDDHTAYDELVKEANEKYKNSPEILDKLGQLFQNNNQNTLAATFLKRSVELKPDDVKTRLSYCYSLLAMRQFNELLGVVPPLFKNEKTKPLANLLAGVSYYNLNQLTKAMPLLAEAYAMAPDHAEVAEAYFDCLITMGKRSAALEPGLMALALQPPYDPHLDVVKKKIQSTVARASTHDLEAGMRSVSLKLPKNRSQAFFCFALGDVFDKSHRYLHAANCFHQGVKLDPGFGRGYMRLAHDLEILGGSPDVILSLYEQALAISRDDKEIKSRLDRMKARVPAMDKDIAGRMKSIVNNVRYKS